MAAAAAVRPRLPLRAGERPRSCKFDVSLFFSPGRPGERKLRRSLLSRVGLGSEWLVVGRAELRESPPSSEVEEYRAGLLGTWLPYDTFTPSLLMWIRVEELCACLRLQPSRCPSLDVDSSSLSWHFDCCVPRPDRFSSFPCELLQFFSLGKKRQHSR